MRLTKLEINGFKSFAKKTEIQFDKGITAIIGPNGSGKSNIADAVRWVLGEQSAKALRGTRMEDVIFNGTQERKAQAFCEVSLTFDNQDGSLPLDFSEIAVTRRVYRSGESEYCINNNSCRLKDISELFRDTGIGKEGYSIIGQGKVEEILSNKSNERRAAFEEAAGVMKYRARKEDAERKLENTQKNLVRLNDILTELEERKGPLEQQSALAREYLILRDELKRIEINLFLQQYDKSMERIRSLTGVIDQLREQSESEEMRRSELSGSCAAIEESERSLENTLNSLQQKLVSLASGVETRMGEAKLLEERIANIRRERERIDQSTAEGAEREARIEKELGGLAGREAEKESELSEKRLRIEAAEEQKGACDEELSEAEAQLESYKTSIMEAMNRISDARSQLSRFEAMETAIGQRMEQLTEQEKSAQDQAEALKEEYAEAERQFEATQEAKRARIDEKDQASARMKECQEKLTSLEKQLFDRKGEQQAKEARLHMLGEMKRAHEGYYASVRNVLNDCAKDPSLKQCVEGVVAELIHVPAEYVTAVEMALGSALQNIVTPDENAAKRVIEHLRKRQYGRATLLPVSVMSGRLLNPKEKACLNTSGCFGVASELIEFDARYRGIVENLLGRTVIVRELDVGIRIARETGNAFRIATLDGDIINPGGSMTGGSLQKREYSLLGRESEIESLKDALKTNAEEQKKLAAAIGELGRERDEHQAELERIEQALQGCEIALAREREKVDIIRRDQNKCDQEIERLAEERSELEENLAELQKRREQAASVQSDLEQGNTATQEDVRRVQKQIAELRVRRDEILSGITREQVSLAGAQKERDALRAEQKRLLSEKAEQRRQSEKDEQSRIAGEAAIRGFEQELASLTSTVGTQRKEVDDLNDQIRKIEEERQAQILSLTELRGRRDSVADVIRDLSERLHRSELNLSKAQMELTSMQDRIWEDYGLTYENALQIKESISMVNAHMRVDELKKAIRALGDVNLNAIEDYRIVRERFDMLTEQCGDLEQAQADLNTLIDELTASMEREFKKQFQLIQENFSVVFSELFGGGRAELVLTDPDDVLNCDIDIIAQPPGKKLSLLSLLSGGERALTAIALLFAILKLKPTAFCLLDEIESSLDETNVLNFAEYLKNYSEQTQFILITHRRGSMAASDALYGVAMEEKGVSTLISARLNKAV
ncbi:MAG: chromosome segregation protein SMC [Bacillota bacterium]